MKEPSCLPARRRRGTPTIPSQNTKQLAAEFLAQQGEADGDNHDQLARFSDAALAIERDKAERARAELVSIADRLASIAEANQRRRGWWRRLVG